MVAEPCDGLVGHEQERGAAVNDGTAAMVAANKEAVLSGAKLHVRHAHGPGVLAQDLEGREDVWVIEGGGVIPDEVSRRAGVLPQADRKDPDVVGLDERGLQAQLRRERGVGAQALLGEVRRELGILGQVPHHHVDVVLHELPSVGARRLGRPHSDDRIEGGILQNRHVCGRGVPEAEVHRLVRADGDLVKALPDCYAAAAKVHGLLKLRVPEVGALAACVDACLAAGVAALVKHHEVEGARVNEAGDRLAADGDVAKVLHVQVVVQELPLRLLDHDATAHFQAVHIRRVDGILLLRHSQRERRVRRREGSGETEGHRHGAGARRRPGSVHGGAQ
mmetsp:Transcript_11912/g.32604  ORF Transcript_11912/g.32604 Transcript_11912/m.32604 type:complete len:335 (+) Transcript_11912:553-1557(+)